MAFPLPAPSALALRPVRSSTSAPSASRLERGQAGRPTPPAETQRGTAVATALAALHRQDPATLRHAVATAALAMAIAAALGRGEREQLHAYDAGLVHDLGKLFVPRRLLRHEGPLDAAARAVFQGHAARGADLARRTPGLEPFVAVIAHHHERWDGAGYPDGLHGPTIPWDARVVAVADVAAVLRAGRPYRAARTVDEVGAELERCAGSQFCPTTVHAALTSPRFGATLATATAA